MVNNYRQTKLDDRQSKKKFTCPGCNHKKCFTPIVYADNNEIVAEHVGRCDRENNCGYIFTYQNYLKEQGLEPGKELQDRKRYIPKPQAVPPPSFIAHGVFAKSMGNYDNNNLFTAFAARFGLPVTEYVFNLYHVGTSSMFGNSAVFWQTDIKGNKRSGKIMLYDAGTMKRVREPQDMVMWVHALKDRNKEPIFPGFNLQQCFFGEHLLITNYHNKPVALVESEKTAIICSLYMPQFVWLATGGSNGCKWAEPAVNKTLRGKAVYLFPDAGYSNPRIELKAFDKWAANAELLKKNGVNVVAVSDYLEQSLTPDEWRQGLDMGDILLRDNHIEYLQKSFPEAFDKATTEAQQIDIVREYKYRGLQPEYIKQIVMELHRKEQAA